MKTSAFGHPGVRAATVLAALWFLSWVALWFFDTGHVDRTGVLGVPWMTWWHITLGALSVGVAVWAINALDRWEDTCE